MTAVIQVRKLTQCGNPPLGTIEYPNARIQRTMKEKKDFTLSIRTPFARFEIDADQEDALTDSTPLILQFVPDLPVSNYDEKKEEYELTFRMTAKVTTDKPAVRPLLQGPCMQDIGVPKELMLMGPEPWIAEALCGAMNYMAAGIWETSKLRGIKQPPFSVEHIKGKPIEGYFIAWYSTYFPDFKNRS